MVKAATWSLDRDKPCPLWHGLTRKGLSVIETTWCVWMAGRKAAVGFSPSLSSLLPLCPTPSISASSVYLVPQLHLCLSISAQVCHACFSVHDYLSDSLSLFPSFFKNQCLCLSDCPSVSLSLSPASPPITMAQMSLLVSCSS